MLPSSRQLRSVPRHGILWPAGTTLRTRQGVRSLSVVSDTLVGAARDLMGLSWPFEPLSLWETPTGHAHSRRILAAYWARCPGPLCPGQFRSRLLGSYQYPPGWQSHASLASLCNQTKPSCDGTSRRLRPSASSCAPGSGGCWQVSLVWGGCSFQILLPSDPPTEYLRAEMAAPG